MRLGLQTCLTGTDELNDIRAAAQAAGMNPYDINAIPFEQNSSHHLKGDLTWPYGSTTLIDNLYRENPSNIVLSYNPDLLTYPLYMKHWAELMLNSEAVIIPRGSIGAMLDIHPDMWYFVRPADDSKQFTGFVTKGKKLHSLEKETMVQGGTLKPTDLLVIDEAYKIKSEYRFFIVNGEIISASTYRVNGQPKQLQGTSVPPPAWKKAREALNRWMPLKSFVLDIAYTGNDFYVLEAGCIHSAGFYAADKKRIFKAINT